MTSDRQFILNINHAAQQARQQFEHRQINPALLSSLYQAYNPLPDIDSFMAQASKLFPRLNCGLASLYLQWLTDKGVIIQGSFIGRRHTFLMFNHSLIADITADQFGGPKIYIGPLRLPWSIERLPAQINKHTSHCHFGQR